MEVKYNDTMPVHGASSCQPSAVTPLADPCPHTYAQRSLNTGGKWYWVCPSCSGVGIDLRNLCLRLDKMGAEA